MGLVCDTKQQGVNGLVYLQMRSQSWDFGSDAWNSSMARIYVQNVQLLEWYTVTLLGPVMGVMQSSMKVK